jgi:hypothetical protein
MPTAQMRLMIGSSVGNVCAREIEGAKATPMNETMKGLRMAGREGYKEVANAVLTK